EQFDGALLVINVSGLVQLIDKFPEKISKHISKYFSQLIQQVYRFGGDVESFAGESMICIFRNFDEKESLGLSGLTRRAIQCASSILEFYSKYNANGIILQIQTGIVAGSFVLMTVGNEKNNRILIGDPFTQFKI